MGAETALSKSTATTMQADGTEQPGKPQPAAESGQTALKRDTNLSDARNQNVIKLAARQPGPQSTVPPADKVLSKPKISLTDDYYPADMLDEIRRLSLSPEDRFFDISRASEVVTVNGKRELRKLKPGESLSAGEHRIRFDRVNKHENKYEWENNSLDEGPIGREFFIQMPELSEEEKKHPVPVVVFLPGVSTTNQRSEDYIPVMQLNKLVDQPSKKFILVTPLPARYSIAERSEHPAPAWHMPGALVPERDVDRRTKLLHYDDRDFLHAVTKMVGQIAPEASRDYADWIWSGFSQGGAVSMRLIGEERFKGMMPNLVIIGSTMEQGNSYYKVADYKVAEGNGEHVTLVMLNGDQLVLPLPGNRLLLPINGAAYYINNNTEMRGLGLDAVDLWHHDPGLLPTFWLKHLGENNQATYLLAHNNDKKLKSGRDFTDPVTLSAAWLTHKNQDQLWKYKPHINQPNSNQEDLEVFALAHAPHSPPNERIATPSGPLVGYKPAWLIAQLAQEAENGQCEHLNSAAVIVDRLFEIKAQKK